AGIGDDLVNPTLVTLVCEGFDSLPTNTEVNTQFAAEGLLVDGASHTGFLGVYTFRQSDDPNSPDNPPVTQPNILRTKSTPTDLAGDEGRINFHFVDPLDGTTPLGATAASLWIIDITSSGGGTADGSVLNAFDPNDAIISTTPVPVGTGGQQQLVGTSDAAGRIQTFQAKLGFSGDSDSGTCDLLTANLNPVSLQTADIVSGGFTASPGDMPTVTLNLYSKARMRRRLKLFFRDSMGTDFPAGQRVFAFAPSPPLGRSLTRTINVPSTLPLGNYTLHLQTIAAANPFVPQTTLHDNFVPVTIQ
ncbi:MAG: hypothetical protein HY292_24225, partial [Planctomycetes bacterium]|nr:hypothetical protein [Planctomycetota bacterium]